MLYMLHTVFIPFNFTDTTHVIIFARFAIMLYNDACNVSKNINNTPTHASSVSNMTTTQAPAVLVHVNHIDV